MPEDCLKVSCYSGYTYAERPESFCWEGMEYNVEEIENSWQEPGERHFKVRTGDSHRFHLRYNQTRQQWSLIELVRSLKQ